MTLKTNITTILETALHSPGILHVIKAGPGEGKTHHTVSALAELMKTGAVKRVIWAVRETVKTNSLGAEAVKKLRTAGVNATLVHGKSIIRAKVHRLTGRWDLIARRQAHFAHARQFDWSSAAEVKVVSHAHLALIYGKDSRSKGGRNLRCLRRAELLVVDEDPADVFLMDEDIIKKGYNKAARKNLRLNHEFFKDKGDLISQALDVLLQRAAKGDFDAQAKSWGREGFREFSLTGAQFWEELENTLHAKGTADWKAFADSIGVTRLGYSSNIKPWVANTMYRALKQFKKGREASAQFGLTWPERREGNAVLDVQFRFNVTQYRPIKCSVVVLDAYAHASHYSAVFSPSQVIIHDVSKGAVLQVKVAAEAGRSRLSVEKDETPEHTLDLMEKVVEYARERGNTLLLCYKSSKSNYQVALDEALKLQPLPEGVVVEIQHWRAGRGSNNWEGWNIIALNEFAFPRGYAEHSLTALMPQATEAEQSQRQQLLELHGHSENLQMLFRGRQTLAVQRGWASTPDVITLYKPDFGDFNPQVKVAKESTYFLPRKKRTTRPRFARAVGTVVQELDLLLGGVPMKVFQVLGLEQRKDAMASQTQAHLRYKLHQLISASPHSLPLLRAWMGAGELAGYEKTKPSQRTSQAELLNAAQAVRPDLSKHSGLRPKQTPKGIRKSENTVLAVSHQSAQAALDALFEEI